MKVIGIVAISLDGCITKHQSEGTSFTSNEDKQFFQGILKTFDCCILGSKTFEVSKNAILKNLSQERLKIVLTSRLARFLQYAREGMLEFKNGDLPEIIKELERRGKKRCALLGGSRVYTECIKHGLMEELWITLEPVGFGIGKRIFEDQVEFHFSLEKVEHLSKDTLLLKYRIK